jgi:ubiquinone/menaquinone biosynthesis C-methylase UbiE
MFRKEGSASMVSATRSQKPNYGIDAPGLLRVFFIVGAAAASASALLAILLSSEIWRFLLITALAMVSLYTLGMGCLMIYGSKVYKVKNVERLFAHLPMSGDEKVLDVGCGGGLLLIAAAKRLTTGQAIGIDVWSSADQSNNKPETALSNARMEGVHERVAIQSGDMRQLPFPDATFDLILSQWAVHNLAEKSDRQTALREMVRTLKPGGKVLLVDIANHAEYASEFEMLGLSGVEKIGPNLLERFYGVVSFGSFLPHAIRATKPWLRQ